MAKESKIEEICREEPIKIIKKIDYFKKNKYYVNYHCSKKYLSSKWSKRSR